MVVFRAFLACLVAVSGSEGQIWIRKHPDRPHMLMGRPAHGFRPPLDPLDAEKDTIPSNLYEEAYFAQVLDHFDPSNNRSWSQHYYGNWQYYVRGGPVFLMIDGEGPGSPAWVTRESLPFVTWAKRSGAGIVDLEHRFYGSSRPVPDQSVDNLKFLSSRQAIEDIATFIQFINQQKGTQNAPWIVFGGSYSGALALWARQAHPELIAGAVGSSGPVNAKLDFYEYLQVVEASLRTDSDSCADNVGQGFNVMTQLMNTEEGRANLSETFKLVPALAETNLTYTDIQTFYGTIFGLFQGAVQYSGDNAGPYATGYGIPEVCTLMKNDSRSLLQRLQDVNEYISLMSDPTGNFTGTGIDYASFIACMQETSWDSDCANDRSWVWQTCTEFGYFQSTDQGQQNIFGATSPNNWNIDFCTDTFGPQFTVSTIADAINSTLNFYGGSERYTGTNVVIPNGSLDPWHALGKYSRDDPTVVPYLIDGTAHCADMYARRDSSPPGLRVIHQLTEQNIHRWINGFVINGPPGSPPTKIKTDDNNEPYKLLQPKQFTSVLTKTFPKFVDYAEPEVSPLRRSLPFLINGRPAFGLRPAPQMKSSRAPAPPGFVAGWITMPLDHFDNTNPGTFQQRYWINPQWAKPGGPNFLMIGGEGPENPAWVTDETLTYLTWAQKYGATVYLLEHRYYGESIINDGKSNQDLRYLSSVQMQYDLRQFILTIKNTNNTAPWITFGGSYSGAMSAWARQLFPDLIVGAVGSSGPVYAKTDFYEYLQVVEASIRTYSNDCANKIGQAFDTMHQLVLTPDGRINLSATFTLDPAWDTSSSPTELDVHYFFSNIFGAFQGAVQYSGDNRGAYANGYGIPEVCAIMNNDSFTPLQAVANVNAYISGMYGPFSSTDNRFQNMIDFFRDETLSHADRLWTWQTCTEFGYYQTTDLGRNIFGSPTPINMYIEMCRVVFDWMNFTAPSIDANVAKTQKFYGGRDSYRGTNVVLPNGSLDPWHALGKYTQNDPSVVPFLINGTAHCADMYPARDTDAADLPTVRQLIDQNIAKWLAPSPQNTTDSPTGTPDTGRTTQATQGTSGGTGNTNSPVITGSTGTPLVVTTSSSFGLKTHITTLIVMSFTFFLLSF